MHRPQLPRKRLGEVGAARVLASSVGRGGRATGRALADAQHIAARPGPKSSPLCTLSILHHWHHVLCMCFHWVSDCTCCLLGPTFQRWPLALPSSRCRSRGWSPTGTGPQLHRHSNTAGEWGRGENAGLISGQMLCRKTRPSWKNTPCLTYLLSLRDKEQTKNLLRRDLWKS